MVSRDIFTVVAYPKSITKMEKIKLSFVSSDNDLDSQLEAYCNINNELFINITSENDYNNAHITLNLHTAIRLVKHLKKEIAVMKEGVENGNI